MPTHDPENRRITSCVLCPTVLAGAATDDGFGPEGFGPLELRGGAKLGGGTLAVGIGTLYPADALRDARDRETKRTVAAVDNVIARVRSTPLYNETFVRMPPLARNAREVLAELIVEELLAVRGQILAGTR